MKNNIRIIEGDMISTKEKDLNEKEVFFERCVKELLAKYGNKPISKIEKQILKKPLREIRKLPLEDMKIIFSKVL